MSLDETIIHKSLSDKEKSTIVNIRKYIKQLAQAHHNDNSKQITSIHEKIDELIHNLVGKEGMTPSEKEHGVSKALSAGDYNAAPSSLTQGAALQTESLIGTKKKKKKKKKKPID